MPRRWATIVISSSQGHPERGSRNPPRGHHEERHEHYRQNSWLPPPIEEHRSFPGWQPTSQRFYDYNPDDHRQEVLENRSIYNNNYQANDSHSHYGAVPYQSQPFSRQEPAGTSRSHRSAHGHPAQVREARHHHSEDKIKQRINEEVPYVSSPPQKPKHAVRPSDEALSDEMVTSIYTVLLNSWCWRRSESEPKDIITPPSEPFELAVREIPVVQGENGAYQLLLDKKCEWGVKTSYDGNCIQYPTILISIPPELSHLTDKSVSEAYQNIVIRGLDEPEALPGIPLCNDAVYGKHAILFKFKGSKDREPHLFYLRTAQDQEKLRQEKEMIQRDIEAEQWLETVRLGRAKHDEATKQRKDRERKEREHAAQKQEREKEWERERDRDRGRTTRRRHSVRR